MLTADIKRVEAAVESLFDMSNIGTSLLDAIQALANAGYNASEIRLSLDMFMWDSRKMQ